MHAEEDAPPHSMLADASGYALQQCDLDLVGLDWRAIENCLSRRAPLGMSLSAYESFVSDLQWFLVNCEGITDADIRLQGSSAKGFSSVLKPFPGTPEDVFNELLSSNPSAGHYEVVEIWGRISDIWGEHLPGQRPFDSMEKLNISPVGSDYDVQISSHQMVQRVHDYIEYMKLSPTRVRVENDKYQFIEKGLAAKCFAHVQRWAFDMHNRLGREVTWVLFDEEGPRKLCGRDSGGSSHFKSDDWIISTPRSPEPREECN